MEAIVAPELRLDEDTLATLREGDQPIREEIEDAVALYVALENPTEMLAERDRLEADT